MKISETSTVTVSLVIAIIVLAFWAGALDTKVTAAQNAVKEVSDAHKEAMEELKDINKQLSRISGFLEKTFAKGKEK